MPKIPKSSKTATLRLPIRLEFEPNRFEQTYLQQAYVQLVPLHSRRLGPGKLPSQTQKEGGLTLAESEETLQANLRGEVL